MLLKILLIIFGLPILILPLTVKIIYRKKLTKAGLIFLIIVVVFAVLQIMNERNNSKNEKTLLEEKIELRNKVDSLNIIALNLSDSLNNLKYILLSIDSQFYHTSNKMLDLRQTNDSLNLKLLETNRPIFYLKSTKIYKNKMNDFKYTIDFYFVNKGTRAATNIFGKMYSVYYDTIYYNGTLPVSTSDIYTNNQGFTYHRPMKINPDSSSLKEPIYYYFKLKYSDLILKTTYPYEIVMKLNPFTKGNCLDELVLCKNWEQQKIKMQIEK